MSRILRAVERLQRGTKATAAEAAFVEHLNTIIAQKLGAGEVW